MNRISQKEFYAIFDGIDCQNIFTEGLSTQMADLKIIRSLCKHFKTKNVLELGVRYGHTAKFILDQCSTIEKYIGVDVNQNFHTKKQSQQTEVPLQTGIMALFDNRFQAITLENGTSDILNNLNIFGCLFDLIFIDADHSFSGVERDTNISIKLLNKNGVIIWHDYGNEKDVTDYLNIISENDNKFIYIENIMLF